jgi:hypothetical protein
MVPRITSEQEKPKGIVERCCETMVWDQSSTRMAWDATVTSDDTIATTTYVIWREEHLRDVGVLQRLPDPVFIFLEEFFK